MGIVQKYGGTSVGDIDKIKAIAQRLLAKKAEGEDLVVVVSAMGKTTDKLIKMAKSVSHRPDDRELDVLLSTGEQQTIALLTMALRAEGQPATSFTGAQAGIITEGRHTANKITGVNASKICEALSRGEIVVVAGFQGVNEEGAITTLGRGGSDTTAVALAASLGFSCEIYTDVDGIYGVDPRKYEDAKRLEQISYEEMMELASLGAGVMEPRAVEIGKKYGVPIYVAHSQRQVTGTWIREVEEMEEQVITGISVSDDILSIALKNLEAEPGQIAEVFSAFSQNEVNIDMISQTLSQDGKTSLSFTCPIDQDHRVDEAIKDIKSSFAQVEISKNSELTKISVVGIGMRNHSGVAGSIFDLFARESIHFEQVTTSEISISYTIYKKDMQRALTLLAKTFEL
jgi:aspartate kinase